MPAPRAIIFDLGKVLVDFDYSIAGRRIAAQSNMSFAAIREYVSSTTLFTEYETGLVTTQQFYDEVCRVTGFRGTLAQFGQYFADIFVEIEPMVRLQAALRQRGLPTYILSNTNELAAEHIRRTFRFYANFDGYVLSYQQRVMKPDPRIYEAVERMASRRGAELLYLDDVNENIQAAAARGWQVILHETVQRTQDAFEKLGLLGSS